jgi:hypothetical protein
MNDTRLCYAVEHLPFKLKDCKFAIWAAEWWSKPEDARENDLGNLTVTVRRIWQPECSLRLYLPSNSSPQITKRHYSFSRTLAGTASSFLSISVSYETCLQVCYDTGIQEQEIDNFEDGRFC